MAKPATLVFLEFPDEVDAYLRSARSSDSATLIALNPATQVYLKRLGYPFKSTLPYFPNEAHGNALRKSEELIAWVRNHLNFIDSHGVKAAYVERFVLLLRLVIHHCLWALEIMDRAVKEQDADALCAYLPSRQDFASATIDPNDRYFGVIGRSYALNRGLEFHGIVHKNGGSLDQWLDRILKRAKCFISSKVVDPTGSPLGRYQIRRLGLTPPILFTTNFYQMDALAARLRQELPDRPLILLTDRRLFWVFARKRGGLPFDAEVSLTELQPLGTENKDSRHRLKLLLEAFVRQVEQASKIFSHLGVSFSDIVAKKVQYGISPYLLGLHHRAGTLRWLLHTLHPSLVISAGTRLDDMIIGELCGRLGIPALLVSHGSHVPPRNQLERIEWGEHGRHLLRAPYPSVAVQSPLAEEFLKTFPSESQCVRTGPLLWGTPINRERSRILRHQLLNGRPYRHVIIHAGTPKARDSFRFHVYETSDEYVQAISDLAKVVRSLDDTCLIIRFRPSGDLSISDLKTLVPFSQNVILSVDGKFGDVLGLADLLVSFSSTTIEEALQNQVPVLLYGGGGRYQHVAGIEVTPEGPCPLNAVYMVRTAERLEMALRRILDVHAAQKTNGALEKVFAPYRFAEGDRIRLADWLNSPSLNRTGQCM